MPPSLGVYLRLTASVAFWGGTWISGRVLAQHMGPFSAAFLRFTVASAFLFLLTCRAEGRAPRLPLSCLPGAFLLGLSGVFLYNFLFFSGLQDIQAGRAALIVAAIPAVIALVSGLFLGERFGALRVLGILASFCGVAVVLSGGDPAALLAQGPRRGDLFILGCVAAWTFYSLAGRRVMCRMSPLSAVTWSCFIGTALLLPAALLQGLAADAARASLGDWLHIVFLGVVATGLAFTWYYDAIRILGASRAGVFINLVPVFAIALGSLFLDEPVGLSLLAGAVLVLGGVWLTNRNSSPAKASGDTGAPLDSPPRA